jgi:hypothetical protein
MTFNASTFQHPDDVGSPPIVASKSASGTPTQLAANRMTSRARGERHASGRFQSDDGIAAGHATAAGRYPG